MEKMKFKFWTWPENPETFHIQALAEPMYTLHEDGTITYEGLGPVCRIISGKGVFRGTDAVEDFNALAVIMATRTAGELSHPLWGTFRAYLTGLTMEQESREGYIAYTYTFREADESGMIPALPEDKEK
jgi:prophage DNA circulation protein